MAAISRPRCPPTVPASTAVGATAPGTEYPRPVDCSARPRRPFPNSARSPTTTTRTGRWRSRPSSRTATTPGSAAVSSSARMRWRRHWDRRVPMPRSPTMPAACSRWAAARFSPTGRTASGSTRAWRSARQGAFPGCRVTVCDARAVFATTARFPAAEEVVVDWQHRYLAAQADASAIDDSTVICVLTHDAKFDVPVLARWRCACRVSDTSGRLAHVARTTTGWRGCGFETTSTIA